MSAYPAYVTEFSKRQNGMGNELDMARISFEHTKLKQQHERAAAAHALNVHKQYNQLRYKGEGVENDHSNRMLADMLGIEFNTTPNGPTYRSPIYESKQDEAFMNKKMINDAAKVSNEMRQNAQCLSAEHWKHQKENTTMHTREIKAIMAQTRAKELVLLQRKGSMLPVEYDIEHQSVLAYTKRMMGDEAALVKYRTQVFEEQEAKHMAAFHKAEQLHQQTYKAEDKILGDFHEKKNTAFREIFDAHHKAVPAAKGAGKGRNKKGCKDGKCDL